MDRTTSEWRKECESRFAASYKGNFFQRNLPKPDIGSFVETDMKYDADASMLTYAINVIGIYHNLFFKGISFYLPISTPLSVPYLKTLFKMDRRPLNHVSEKEMRIKGCSPLHKSLIRRFIPNGQTTSQNHVSERRDADQGCNPLKRNILLSANFSTFIRSISQDLIQNGRDDLKPCRAKDAITRLRPLHKGISFYLPISTPLSVPYLKTLFKMDRRPLNHVSEKEMRIKGCSPLHKRNILLSANFNTFICALSQDLIQNGQTTSEPCVTAEMQIKVAALFLKECISSKHCLPKTDIRSQKPEI
ncbi:hypothetical protein AVEN_32457-1 [Araneus ventricosus]|uniref:Uncharacterized protein n=1 Tax=Araneus ventricosus TaxID=182803 RepID=A0A4Y2XC03_ARAVE|nr:hypothetical protein AVEN_32457-1 [Araneus ventricosus]